MRLSSDLHVYYGMYILTYTHMNKASFFYSIVNKIEVPQTVISYEFLTLGGIFLLGLLVETWIYLDIFY